jgi:hypothetical protein
LTSENFPLIYEGLPTVDGLRWAIKSHILFSKMPSILLLLMYASKMFLKLVSAMATTLSPSLWFLRAVISHVVGLIYHVAVLVHCVVVLAHPVAEFIHHVEVLVHHVAGLAYHVMLPILHVVDLVHQVTVSFHLWWSFSSSCHPFPQFR